MKHAELLELAGEIECALEDCRCIQHVATNAFGEVRFRTESGEVFEIVYVKKADWHDGNPKPLPRER